jgi:hypothetical protein
MLHQKKHPVRHSSKHMTMLNYLSMIRTQHQKVNFRWPLLPELQATMNQWQDGVQPQLQDLRGTGDGGAAYLPCRRKRAACAWALPYPSVTEGGWSLCQLRADVGGGAEASIRRGSPFRHCLRMTCLSAAALPISQHQANSGLPLWNSEV